MAQGAGLAGFLQILQLCRGVCTGRDRGLCGQDLAGCAGVCAWVGIGDFVDRILQVLILHLKHTKGQNLEQRGWTYSALFSSLGCSHPRKGRLCVKTGFYCCLTSLCFMNSQSSCWLCKSPQAPSTLAHVPKSAKVTMETEGPISYLQHIPTIF